MKTLRLQIILDDNGAIQKVRDFSELVDKQPPKAHASARATHEMAQAFGDLTSIVGRAVPGVHELGIAIERVMIASPGLGMVTAGFAGLTLAAGAATGALVHVVNSTAAQAQSLENLSRVTGIAIEPLQAVGAVAKRSGVSVDEMANAIGNLSRRIGERDPTMQQWLVDLAVPFEQIIRLNPEQRFIKVAESIARVGDQAFQDAAKVALFGRTGLQASAMFTSALGETIAAQQQLGVVLDEQTNRTLAAYNEKVDVMGQRWDAFKARTLSPVAELFGEILDRINRMAEHPTFWQRLMASTAFGAAGALMTQPTAPGPPQVEPLPAHAAGGAVRLATSHGDQIVQANAIEAAVRQMATAVNEGGLLAQRRLDQLGKAFVPLSAEAEATAIQMRAFGKSNEYIADTLSRMTGNVNITIDTVNRLFQTIELTKQVDLAWAEQQKATIAATREGFAARIAMEEAAHQIRVRLIQRDVKMEADKAKLIEAENARYAATRMQIETEAAREIRDLRTQANADMMTLASSHYGNLLDRQRAALEIELNTQIEQAKRKYATEEEANAAILALTDRYWAKRMGIEEAALNRRQQLLEAERQAELVARQQVLGITPTGLEVTDDPRIKAARDYEAALAALNVKQIEGFDVSLRRMQVDQEYVATLQRLDAEMNNVAKRTEHATAQMIAFGGTLVTGITDIDAFNQAVSDLYDKLSVSQFGTFMQSMGAATDIGRTGYRALRPSVMGRAVGGPVWPGQGFMVGERGPELVVPNMAGYVSPFTPGVGNLLSAQPSGINVASPGQLTINVDARGAQFTDDRQLDRLVDRIASRIGQRASLGARF